MEDLAQSWRETFTPRDRRPIVQWAREHIKLSPPITKTGPFDISDSRHFEGIFESLQNDHKREVNVLKPVRGGGSLIGDVFCPWTIANDPGQYMDVFQTEPIATEHSEARIKPIFRDCEPIKKLLPSDRHKNRNDEIVFTHGYTWYVRGPSLANLQAKGIRYLRLEEVWMWPQGRMAEAEGRVGDYLKLQTSKILRISQGGPTDGVEMEQSDWFKAYHRAQVHEWEAQCLNCSKHFDPIFGGTRPDGSFWGMTWNRYMLPNGDWDIPKCLPTIRFECPHCAHPMLDGARTKGEWNRTGRYRIANAGPAEAGTPSAKRDSFHWECVIDFPWDELVELWLQACNDEKRGDLKAKIQFYQKRRAMFMDEEHLLKRGMNFRRTIYEINSDLAPDEARFMSVDRQEEDLFWWTVRAWFPTECRRLGFGKCYGFGEVETIRDKFKVQPNRTFVDSGYNPKGDHGVYSACVKYGWIAVRGSGEHSFIHVLKNKRRVLKSYAPLAYGDPETGSLRRRCPLIRFSKFQMNQKVKELIDSGYWKEPQPGSAACSDPEMEKEYNAQMAARVKKVEYNARTGESKHFFMESKNDHASDLANMNCLGGVLAEKVPDPAEERLAKSEKEAAG